MLRAPLGGRQRAARCWFGVVWLTVVLLSLDAEGMPLQEQQEPAGVALLQEGTNTLQSLQADAGQPREAVAATAKSTGGMLPLLGDPVDTSLLSAEAALHHKKAQSAFREAWEAKDILEGASKKGDKDWPDEYALDSTAAKEAEGGTKEEDDLPTALPKGAVSAENFNNMRMQLERAQEQVSREAKVAATAKQEADIAKSDAARVEMLAKMTNVGAMASITAQQRAMVSEEEGRQTTLELSAEKEARSSREAVNEVIKERQEAAIVAAKHNRDEALETVKEKEKQLRKNRERLAEDEVERQNDRAAETHRLFDANKTDAKKIADTSKTVGELQQKVAEKRAEAAQQEERSSKAAARATEMKRLEAEAAAEVAELSQNVTIDRNKLTAASERMMTQGKAHSEVETQLKKAQEKVKMTKNMLAHLIVQAKIGANHSSILHDHQTADMDAKQAEFKNQAAEMQKEASEDEREAEDLQSSMKNASKLSMDFSGDESVENLRKQHALEEKEAFDKLKQANEMKTEVSKLEDQLTAAEAIVQDADAVFGLAARKQMQERMSQLDKLLEGLSSAETRMEETSTASADAEQRAIASQVKAAASQAAADIAAANIDEDSVAGKVKKLKQEYTHKIAEEDKQITADKKALEGVKDIPEALAAMQTMVERRQEQAKEVLDFAKQAMEKHIARLEEEIPDGEQAHKAADVAAKKDAEAASDAKTAAEKLRSRLHSEVAEVKRHIDDLLGTARNSSKFFAAKAIRTHTTPLISPSSQDVSLLHLYRIADEDEAADVAAAQDLANTTLYELSEQVEKAQVEIEALQEEQVDADVINPKRRALVQQQFNQDRARAQEASARASVTSWNGELKKLEQLEADIADGRQRVASTAGEGLKSQERFLREWGVTLTQRLKAAQEQLMDADKVATEANAKALSAIFEAKQLKESAEEMVQRAKVNSQQVLDEAQRQVHAAAVNLQVTKSELDVAKAQMKAGEAKAESAKDSEKDVETKQQALEKTQEQETTAIAQMEAKQDASVASAKAAQELVKLRRQAQNLTDTASAAETRLADLTASLHKAEEAKGEEKIQSLLNETHEVEANITALRSQARSLREQAANMAEAEGKGKNALVLALEQAQLQETSAEKAKADVALSDAKVAADAAAADVKAAAATVEESEKQLEATSEMKSGIQSAAKKQAKSLEEAAAQAAADLKVKAKHANKAAQEATVASKEANARVEALKSLISFLGSGVKEAEEAFLSLMQEQITEATFDLTVAQAKADIAEEFAAEARHASGNRTESRKITAATALLTEAQVELTEAKDKSSAAMKQVLTQAAPSQDAVKAMLLDSHQELLELKDTEVACTEAEKKADDALSQAKDEHSALMKSIAEEKTKQVIKVRQTEEANEKALSTAQEESAKAAEEVEEARLAAGAKIHTAAEAKEGVKHDSNVAAAEAEAEAIRQEQKRIAEEVSDAQRERSDLNKKATDDQSTAAQAKAQEEQLEKQIVADNAALGQMSADQKLANLEAQYKELLGEVRKAQHAAKTAIQAVNLHKASIADRESQMLSADPDAKATIEVSIRLEQAMMKSSQRTAARAQVVSAQKQKELKQVEKELASGDMHAAQLKKAKAEKEATWLQGKLKAEQDMEVKAGSDAQREYAVEALVASNETVLEARLTEANAKMKAEQAKVEAVLAASVKDSEVVKKAETEAQDAKTKIEDQEAKAAEAKGNVALHTKEWTTGAIASAKEFAEQMKALEEVATKQSATVLELQVKYDDAQATAKKQAKAVEVVTERIRQLESMVDKEAAAEIQKAAIAAANADAQDAEAAANDPSQGKAQSAKVAGLSAKIAESEALQHAAEREAQAELSQATTDEKEAKRRQAKQAVLASKQKVEVQDRLLGMQKDLLDLQAKAEKAKDKAEVYLAKSKALEKEEGSMKAEWTKMLALKNKCANCKGADCDGCDKVADFTVSGVKTKLENAQADVAHLVSALQEMDPAHAAKAVELEEQALRDDQEALKREQGLQGNSTRKETDDEQKAARRKVKAEAAKTEGDALAHEAAVMSQMLSQEEADAAAHEASIKKDGDTQLSKDKRAENELSEDEKELEDTLARSQAKLAKAQQKEEEQEAKERAFEKKLAAEMAKREYEQKKAEEEEELQRQQAASKQAREEREKQEQAAAQQMLAIDQEQEKASAEVQKAQRRLDDVHEEYQQTLADTMAAATEQENEMARDADKATQQGKELQESKAAMAKDAIIKRANQTLHAQKDGEEKAKDDERNAAEQIAAFKAKKDTIDKNARSDITAQAAAASKKIAEIEAEERARLAARIHAVQEEEASKVAEIERSRDLTLSEDNLDSEMAAANQRAKNDEAALEDLVKQQEEVDVNTKKAIEVVDENVHQKILQLEKQQEDMLKSSSVRVQRALNATMNRIKEQYYMKKDHATAQLLRVKADAMAVNQTAQEQMAQIRNIQQDEEEAMRRAQEESEKKLDALRANEQQELLAAELAAEEAQNLTAAVNSPVLKNAKEKLGETQQAVTSALEKVSTLQEKLKQHTDAVKEEMATYEESKAEVVTEVNAARDALNSSQVEVIHAETAIKANEEAVANMEAVYQGVLKEVDTVEETVKETKKYVHKQTEAVQTEEGDLFAEEATLSASKATLDDIDGNLGVERAQVNATLRIKISQREQQAAMLQENIQDLESRSKPLETSLTDAEEMIAAYTRTMEVAEQHLTAAQVKAKQRATDVTALESEIEQLVEESAVLDTEAAEAAKKSQSALDLMRNATASLQLENAKLQEQKEQAEDTTARMVEIAGKRKIALDEQTVRTQSQTTGLTRQADDIKSSVERGEAQLAKLKVEIRSTAEEMKDEEAKLGAETSNVLAKDHKTVETDENKVSMDEAKKTDMESEIENTEKEIANDLEKEAKMKQQDVKQKEANDQLKASLDLKLQEANTELEKEEREKNREDEQIQVLKSMIAARQEDVDTIVQNDKRREEDKKLFATNADNLEKQREVGEQKEQDRQQKIIAKLQADQEKAKTAEAVAEAEVAKLTAENVANPDKVPPAMISAKQKRDEARSVLEQATRELTEHENVLQLLLTKAEARKTEFASSKRDTEREDKTTAERSAYALNAAQTKLDMAKKQAQDLGVSAQEVENHVKASQEKAALVREQEARLAAAASSANEDVIANMENRMAAANEKLQDHKSRLSSLEGDIDLDSAALKEAKQKEADDRLNAKP